jgi:hypothetical protein
MTSTLTSESPAAARPLLDDIVPRPDATAAVTVMVDAPAETTFACVKSIDFAEIPRRDPLMGWLIAARAVPDRIARMIRGEEAGPPMAEAGARLGDMTEGPDEWVRLGETPGQEFAFGAIGRFMGAQVNWRPTAASEFGTFAEPGYVKVAAAMSVRPYGDRRCLLTYDCRSAASDDSARAAFKRYWRLVSPGIRLVLWRAAVAVRREAEGRR